MSDIAHLTISRRLARQLVDWLADDAIIDSDVTEYSGPEVAKFAEALMNALDEAQGQATEPNDRVAVTITIQGGEI